MAGNDRNGPGPAPTVKRRRLVAELRRLRDESGLPREEVAERLEWHASKIKRIETGRWERLSPTDLRALLDVYGVTEREQQDVYVRLARESKEKGWWHSYRDVLPNPYAVLIEMEAEAASFRSFELAVVPGLLQTEDYTRALIRGDRREASDEEIQRRVEVRTTRQQVLQRENTPRFWAILDEAALRRQVGGKEVMRAQYHHLVKMTKLPKVTVQVIPFTQGAHTAMSSSFTILEFPEEMDPDVVYVETMAGDLYLEEKPDVQERVLAFEHLRASALSEQDTLAFISDIAEGL